MEMDMESSSPTLSFWDFIAIFLLRPLLAIGFVLSLTSLVLNAVYVLPNHSTSNFQQFSTWMIQILIPVRLLLPALRASTCLMDRPTSKHHQGDTLMVVLSSISLQHN